MKPGEAISIPHSAVSNGNDGNGQPRGGKRAATARERGKGEGSQGTLIPHIGRSTMKARGGTKESR